MSLSNSSIGADAPAAAFGKTAFADFASAGYNYDKNFIHLPRQYLPERQRAVYPAGHGESGEPGRMFCD